MPADAPLQRPTVIDGALPLYRAYRDAFARPLIGQVTIAGSKRAQAGDVVTVAAPVTAQVVDGVLDVALPAGTYQLHAQLTTVDGARVDDTETVTL